jgi:hypothetical protein
MTKAEREAPVVVIEGTVAGAELSEFARAAEEQNLALCSRLIRWGVSKPKRPKRRKAGR